MKSFVLLLVLSLGFAANAETKEYIISHPCPHGEVAAVESNPVPKGDGTFIVRATCIPADCNVSLPHNGVYTVSLINQARMANIINPTIALPSWQVISQIKASSKSEAKVEVQKLVDQGYCSKYRFTSGFDNL